MQDARRVLIAAIGNVAGKSFCLLDLLDLNGFGSTAQLRS